MKSCCGDSFQRGYDRAFADMYRASGDDDHMDRCGECRACGVVHTVIEDVVQQLTAFMTEEEFWVFSSLVEDVKDRRDLLKMMKRNRQS